MRRLRIVLLCAIACAVASPAPRAVSPDIVISQVYGGGGNAGATLRNDFIELYNRGTVPVSVTGWTVQYASSAGTTWQSTPLTGTIAPGAYFLVQEGQGAGGTTNLPTPDATGTINMSGTTGKVALVRTSALLSGGCPIAPGDPAAPSIADFAGYGSSATCSEGAPTATLSNTTAAIRAAGGATDTDNNALDFSAGTPQPRNGGLVIAPPANVVISQVYGGGGNSGAIYRNDFVELRNLEPVAVSVNGWTIQYSSAGGTTWSTTALAGTIPPNGFYLIQEAAGSGGTTALPTPDATGGIAMAAGSGKVALVADPGALTGACPLAATLDLVGYGSANCFEGAAPAPGLDNETAARRANDGLLDTNENAFDFARGAPNPRSTIGVPPTGIGTAAPASVADGGVTLLTVAVTAGAFPPSPISSVTADLSAIGGGAVTLVDDGTAGDAIAGDAIYSRLATVSGAAGLRTVAAAIADARGRIGTAAIRLAIEAPLTAIGAIQGSGSTSPLVGQFVTTSGIVTARRFSGFYVQSPDGGDDLDAATADGIFVFTGSSTAQPAVGDAVRVSAIVAEFAPAPPDPSLTELGGGPVWAASASGQPLPVPVTLSAADTSPSGGREQLERFEGMRVRATLLVIAGTDGAIFEESATAESNGDFFAVIDGVSRPVREPGLDPSDPVPPGLPCCVPRFDGNPERLRVDSNGQIGAPRLEVAAGQRFVDAIGVLDYSFGAYTLLPDAGAGTIDGAQAATPVPEANPGEFTVASFNLERFFDETDDPDTDEPILTPDAVARRLQKASLAVRSVLRLPDILAVIEVENLSILQRLAARINADEVAAGRPDPGYAGYLEEGNDIGGIDSGFLVKSARVLVDGVEQIGRDATYTPPGHTPGSPLPLLNDRPPLVLRARVSGPIAQPFPITVIANHLRSLSGIAGDDGERIRAKRRAQAEFLAALIQSRQATERIISVGDYNAGAFNDGLVDVVGTVKGMPAPADQVALATSDLVTPDLISLGDSLGPSQQYSFVFDGNAQAIDHILVNASALKRASRVAYARSNADFPESLRNDPERPERLSDHDAIVGYFSLPGAPIVTLAGGATIDVEAFTTFTDPGATAHDDEGPLAVTVSGTVDVNTAGDYTLSYTATNGYVTTTITRLVRVRDTIAPAISGFALSPRIIWPPNGRLVDVTVAYAVADASSTATCGLSVASNEASGARPDWVVVDPHHVRLRAEWAGLIGTRVYTVTTTCTDAAGNSTQASARAFVPGLLAILLSLL
jgi:predicted extracellular nuclease